MTFSPDGNILATQEHSSTKLWNITLKKEIAKLDDGRIGFNLAFSPDSKLLARSGYGVVHLWDVASKQALAPLRGHSSLVIINSLAFSPDANLLASAGFEEGTVKLWDLASMQEVATLKGNITSPQSIAFSADGKSLMVLGGRTLEIWKASPDEEVKAQLNILD